MELNCTSGQISRWRCRRFMASLRAKEAANVAGQDGDDLHEGVQGCGGIGRAGPGRAGPQPLSAWLSRKKGCPESCAGISAVFCLFAAQIEPCMMHRPITDAVCAHRDQTPASFRS
jgi:hypothetical protein